MILTDTHTHLYSEAFDEDRERAIQRAIDLGVQRFFIPAIDSTYTQAMFDLKQKHPDKVFLMMGLHPTHVKETYETELAHVVEMLNNHQFYAVGEIGKPLFDFKSVWPKNRVCPLSFTVGKRSMRSLKFWKKKRVRICMGFFIALLGISNKPKKPLDTI